MFNMDDAGFKCNTLHDVLKILSILLFRTIKWVKGMLLNSCLH